MLGTTLPSSRCYRYKPRGKEHQECRNDSLSLCRGRLEHNRHCVQSWWLYCRIGKPGVVVELSG